MWKLNLLDMVKISLDRICIYQCLILVFRLNIYIYINTIELFCFETSIFLDNETDKRNFSKNFFEIFSIQCNRLK